MHCKWNILLIIFYFYIEEKNYYFSDVRHAISAYPPGTLRKMACYFVRTTIGPLTAKRVRVAVRSLQALLCWQAITNFTQNALPVLLAVLLSEMAKVMRSSNGPNYTAGFAISGRCNHSTGQRIIPLLENHIALDWSKYLLAQQIQINREESNSR